MQTASVSPHRTTDIELVREHAAMYRERSKAFALWAAGYGVIRHEATTQVRIHELAELLEASNGISTDAVFMMLHAADRIACAGMWLVAHMTYAKRVRFDGAPLCADDMKASPEGHTGGALNMVPAYVGYMIANAITGTTRGWLMGQGHCVAAIDAVNVLLGNTDHEQRRRYSVSDDGLSQMVRDFYSYALSSDGRPASPLGSHVNAHTAGGIAEGGYLGFAELSYVHMPLPGERLVAFLSDGAFEEQRGSDWAPRYWRAEDTGLVTPIMIANGRRIDQRSTVNQEGGPLWLREHLEVNGFDPMVIDGRDPAAFVWGILTAEQRLEAAGNAVMAGDAAYPVALPYVIADTEKGFGFPGAGTNRAHNLPLRGNPHTDAGALAELNSGMRALWVSLADVRASSAMLANHAVQRRPRELAHPMATRDVAPLRFSPIPWKHHGCDSASPMDAIDRTFLQIVRDNPTLRPRVGNPDEMRSNHMSCTLDALKHRVCEPEPGAAEAVDGKVITALNEEAVVCAALGNKGGINIVVSYEAFAVKMLGALRQDLIFARHQREVAAAPGWLSVPIVATSHLWENGKNEQSHQDPTLCEALMHEMADSARVVFPADWNSAAETLQSVYRNRGQIWNLVVPKRDVPVVFTADESETLVRDGAILVSGHPKDPVQLVAVGAYQLDQARRAATRLEASGVACSVVYVIEPGKFRTPRDVTEVGFVASRDTRGKLFPTSTRARIFMVHGHADAFLGVMRPLDLGPDRTRALGYANRGGTLDVPGMLEANGCTWREAIHAIARILGRAHTDLVGDEAVTPEPLARPDRDDGL